MRHASELRSTRSGGRQGPGGKRLSRRTMSVSAVGGALVLITASAWLGTMTTQAKTVTDAPATKAAKAAARAYELPPANAVWDYQIGGPYTPVAAVGIVDRDHTAAAAAGKYNICYVNGYQTQPGESKSWPTAALLKDKNGKLVEDKEWPGEYMVDTRTATSRTAIMSVVGAWIDSCASKGFKAVEVDNLDSFTRDPSKQSTEAGNMALAKQLVERSHGKGLAIGQKNTVELAGKGRSTGFDFAVVESCQVYKECNGYTDVYGTQVYEVEYVEEGGLNNFNAACKARGAKISITYRDVLVKPSGQSGYTFKYC
jgi:glycosyl hydrolase family 114